MALCSANTEEHSADFLLCSTLKPHLELKSVQKNISNPYSFRGSPMVTTFFRLAGSRTKGMKFSRKDQSADIRLAELEYPSLRKIMPYCSSRDPIYGYPCFYQSLKLQFPLNIGGLSRDGTVTTELSNVVAV